MTKVAFPTDDGESISRHLGQAKYYVVAEIGAEPAKLEKRLKRHHDMHADSGSDHHHAEHGFHQTMFAPLADCQVLISGGMGQPAYQQAVSSGLQVILTGETTIASALKSYQSGALVSDTRRVHHTH